MRDLVREEYYQLDYYRMTGQHYKRGLKSFMEEVLYHNLQFAYWYRKYQQNKGVFSSGCFIEFLVNID